MGTGGSQGSGDYTALRAARTKGGQGAAGFGVFRLRGAAPREPGAGLVAAAELDEDQAQRAGVGEGRPQALRGVRPGGARRRRGDARRTPRRRGGSRAAGRRGRSATAWASASAASASRPDAPSAEPRLAQTSARSRLQARGLHPVRHRVPGTSRRGERLGQRDAGVGPGGIERDRLLQARHRAGGQIPPRSSASPSGGARSGSPGPRASTASKRRAPRRSRRAARRTSPSVSSVAQAVAVLGVAQAGRRRIGDGRAGGRRSRARAAARGPRDRPRPGAAAGRDRTALEDPPQSAALVGRALAAHVARFRRGPARGRRAPGAGRR